MAKGKTQARAKAKPAAPRKKMGRPGAYRPEYAGQAAKLCRLGATDADLADFFGVTITTVKNWYAQHEDFLAAQKANKPEANGRVERSLYQRATGYSYDSVKIFMPAGAKEPVIVPIREHVPPDTTAMIFWLKNRDRERWRDKVDHEHGGKDGAPIQVEHSGDIGLAAVLAKHKVDGL